jgi:predicted exporter
LLAALLLAGGVFRSVRLRSDMADFLPAGQTDAARLMLEQLRTGAAANLLLIGVEGAAPADLARISRSLAGGLQRSGRFAFVENGTHPFGGEEAEFLSAHRYLLSGVTTPASFETPALRRDMQGLLAALRSSAAGLVVRFGLADPPGALRDLARHWIGGTEIHSEDGVWFATDRDRAVLVARTRAGGLDIAGQEDADAALRAAFAAARPGSARLLVTGPAVFSREAANGIRDDVRLLSVVSVVLIATLLLWRFRSPLVIATIAVPIVLSMAVAALAVQLLFGFVHAIAFGFGMTMLGVTVDYPVLLIGHRKQNEAAAGTLRRIGRTFNLAVTTAALGLTGMAFSGFPGIAQLGSFSAVGLLTAAAATRWILPPLIVAADLAPVSAGDPARLLQIEQMRRWRALGAIPIALALGVLVWHPPRLQRDLASLTPVPQAALDLDAQLRKEVGAPDVGQVAVLRGSSADDVLQQEERALPEIDSLISEHAIGGADLAARLMPSVATQRARIAALPDDATLRARIAEAQNGLPFRADAFAAFAGDVAASRQMAPVTLSDIANPEIAARLQPLLFRRDDRWFGLVVPRGVTDPERLRRGVGKIPGALFVDVARETNAIVAAYTTQALRLITYGASAALLALMVALRNVEQIARIVLSLAAAGLVTVAVLQASGTEFSMIHVVALQFAAGVGLDYALFFARRQLDGEERARTLRTLITCNAMTLLTFGLLAFCRTPLLREIGQTVAIGAIAAFVSGFLIAGEIPQRAA